MSALVDRALHVAGLAAVLEARNSGALHGALVERLREADLLALGALADRVRSAEVGDDVRIYLDPDGTSAASPRRGRHLNGTSAASPRRGQHLNGTSAASPRRGGCLDDEAEGAQVILLPDGDRELTGLELLREVAIARIGGAKGARVRVDFVRCGLELAQVAVGFGANELVGRMANKRGLALVQGEKLGVGKKSRWEDAEAVKRNELAGFVRRAGRKPVFVEEESTACPEGSVATEESTACPEGSVATEESTACPEGSVATEEPTACPQGSVATEEDGA